MKRQGGQAVTKDLQPRDIKERTFEFALAIVRLCRALETRAGTAGVLSRQLLRSGTSIGANVEEAQAGQSRADFICKYAIALKEAREALYWVRLLQAADGERQNETGKEQSQGEVGYGELVNEAREIASVIGAIVVKARRGAK